VHEPFRRAAVGGADRVCPLDEVLVREAAAASAAAEERGGETQACSSSSTSPGSGNRRACDFEKTTAPSFTTSN
jgi:hypothetical protein